jgi:hypothetical protein
MPEKTLNQRGTATFAVQHHAGLRRASARRRSRPGLHRAAPGPRTWTAYFRHHRTSSAWQGISSPGRSTAGDVAGARSTPGATGGGIRATPAILAAHYVLPPARGARELPKAERRTGMAGRGIFTARILDPPPARHARGRGIAITLFPCCGVLMPRVAGAGIRAVAIRPSYPET